MAALAQCEILNFCAPAVLHVIKVLLNLVVLPPSSQNAPSFKNLLYVNREMATGDEPEKQSNALHTTQDKDIFTVQWGNYIR